MKDDFTLIEKMTDDEYNYDIGYIMYFYIVIGMMNSIVPIYSLRLWQLHYLYIYRKNIPNLPVENLLQLPTASGKSIVKVL